jgi:hypothetical protein
MMVERVNINTFTELIKAVRMIGGTACPASAYLDRYSQVSQQQRHNEILTLNQVV